MVKVKYLMGMVLSVALISCGGAGDGFVEENVGFARKQIRNIKWNHDVGFMIYCSFGNGLRLTGDPAYKEMIVEAARSLSTRFRPVAGIIVVGCG